MNAIAHKTDDTLKDHVEQIADNITNGIPVTQDDVNDYHEYGYEIGDTLDGFHYLHDVLDIRYLINSEDELIKVEILVAFGGPNIWVDIWNDGTGEVRGYWWGDSATAAIHADHMFLFEILNELREC